VHCRQRYHKDLFWTDNRVQSMPAFYSALVEALQKTRAEGQEEYSAEDVLTLT
jgi:hypothetical protein